MLLWVTLLAGLLLVSTVLVVTMFRAERRARRKLFEALGLGEETIELLMSRNGDVLTELSLARILPPVSANLDVAERPLPTPAPDSPPSRRHPTIRLVHPAADEPDAPDTGQGPSNSQRHRGA